MTYQDVVEAVAQGLRSMITASHYNQLEDDEFYRRIASILSLQIGNLRVAVIEVRDNNASEFHSPIGKDWHYIYLRCCDCGKKCATYVPANLDFILRATVTCPECIEKRAGWHKVVLPE